MRPVAGGTPRRSRRHWPGSRPGTTLLINVPNWPDWMDADHDGFLDADQTDAYARLCADLVRIVNGDLKKRVVYWEVTNERDELYFVNFHQAVRLGASQRCR